MSEHGMYIGLREKKPYNADEEFKRAQRIETLFKEMLWKLNRAKYFVTSLHANGVHTSLEGMEELIGEAQALQDGAPL